MKSAIDAWMRFVGMPPAELARQSGLSYWTVREVALKGCMPNARTLLALADALGVSAEVLMRHSPADPKVQEIADRVLRRHAERRAEKYFMRQTDTEVRPAA